jgi:two-component system, OmpR family, phosphate regulon sensor histidine kinase PhoR
MIKSFILNWTIKFKPYWRFIYKRNFWFIKLRFGAFGMLIGLILLLEFILQADLSKLQLLSLIGAAVFMLCYNFLFYSIRNKVSLDEDKFNPFLFAFIQIITDLLVLSFVCYVTGGIISPFAMFFIFHAIIGSIYMPGKVIYPLIGLIILIYDITGYFQYSGAFSTLFIPGMSLPQIKGNHNLFIIYASCFSFMMGVSIFIANSIARELYKREEELQRTLDKLFEAEAAKQKYTIAVVHEIKSPIVAAQLYLQIILNNYLGPVPPAVEEKLARTLKRLDEGIEIISDVLKISKLKLLENIKKEHLILEEVIYRSIDQKINTAHSKNISLEFTDNRILKYKVLADEVLLDLALSNLIGNAVKYTSKGGKVLVEVNEDENNNIIIEVSDDGIGIAENELQKIFRQFYRTTNIKHQGYEGTGLGLSIVKEIVDQHGWTIEAKSPSKLADEKGFGTAFTIIIPHEE